MRIDAIVNDGSPLKVTCKSIFGDDGRVGIGGSELALLTMCEEWHKAGHEVVLFNDPNELGASPFEQRYLHQFDPQGDRDILITFRSPNPKSIGANGFHVWWSCDQYTIGSFAEFAPYAQKIVCISDFHAKHFAKEYGIRNTTVIDLPVRVDDYTVSIEKVPGRCLFASVPDRGLMILHAAWPLIKRDFPEASLTITSDYRLWGVGEPRNENFRRNFMLHKDVKFKGALPRREFVKEQLQAQLLTYTNIYDELYCISCAEAQVAGAYPVTSSVGALRTTNMGLIVEGKPTDPNWVAEYVKQVVGLLSNPDLPKIQEENRQKAIERFRPERILEEWEKKIFI